MGTFVHTLHVFSRGALCERGVAAPRLVVGAPAREVREEELLADEEGLCSAHARGRVVVPSPSDRGLP